MRNLTRSFSSGLRMLLLNVKALSEVEFLKKRVEDLELELRILRDNAIKRDNAGGDVGRVTGTPYVDLQDNHNASFGRVVGLEQVRKRLSFEEKMSPRRKMAPSTPAGSKPSRLNSISIGDSDDDTDIGDNQFGTPDVKRNVRSVSTSKRKRAPNVFCSDSETDEDDNVPLAQWKAKKVHNQHFVDEEYLDVEDCSMTPDPSRSDDMNRTTTRRRRLVKMKQYEGNVADSDNESAGSGSVNEDDSSSGFIDDSPVSDGDGDGDESDAAVELDKILVKLSRSEDRKKRWEFEADMLAAFGKDPELCMKAVCALYRQQTCDEKFSKEALYHNSRGFSKFDALRGTRVAEFLTDGDPQGDVVKSVQELEAYDPEGVELCRMFATRYSKQLFDIYKSKEDPLFLPHKHGARVE